MAESESKVGNFDTINQPRNFKNDTKELQQQNAMTEIAPECLIQHPLRNTWTLWYFQNDRTKSFEQNQNKIANFNTIEDFRSLYDHIKLASEIKVGSDYSLFKKGIRPMWEDEAHIKGGSWVITLPKQCRRIILDKLWLDVSLRLVEESFEHSDQICGAKVNIRCKGDKISIWTVDGSNEEAVLKIGHKLKELLDFDPEKVTLVYQLHKDTMAKKGSKIKSTYVL